MTTQALSDFVRSEDDWEVIDMPQSARGAQEYYSLLVENGTLAGNARYCLTQRGDLMFRSEIPRAFGLESDQDEAQECQEPGQVDAGLLCMATGWPCTSRANDRIAVELETRIGPASAIVTPMPNGMDISFDLLTLIKGESPAQQCLEALGLFLLRLAGNVRMVRPVARPLDDRTVIQLSVHVPTGAKVWHVSHAFAALSIAVDLGRAECRALLQPAIAGIFLTTNRAN